MQRRYREKCVLPFLCHKSATTCQIDSNMVSNSKLKPDRCNCVTTETIKATSPPQQQCKRDTISCDLLYLFDKNCLNDVIFKFQNTELLVFRTCIFKRHFVRSFSSLVNSSSISMIESYSRRQCFKNTSDHHVVFFYEKLQLNLIFFLTRLNSM